MTSAEVPFRDRYGLHPRAALLIQRTAGGFRSRITIESVGGDHVPVDARSMMSLVSSGIRAGDTVCVQAVGDDEGEAAEALRALIERGVCHP